MKKILLLTVVIFSSLSLSPLYAYDVQPGDNALLTKVYDRIDTVYEQDHMKLVTFLDSIFGIELRYATNPQSTYFLEKIKEYIHGKLYTFVESPEYVCIDSRVQHSDSVTLQYSLQTTDGKKITLPAGKEMIDEENFALIFNAGKGQVISGIDDDVLGKRSNKNYDVYLQARDARGNTRPGLILTIPVSNVLELSPNIALGDTLTMSIEIAGVMQKRPGVVVDISAESIAIDFNHPLAGETIVGQYVIENFFKSCR